jgi:hypothetical protein
MPDGRKDIKGAKERLFETDTDPIPNNGSRSGEYDLYLEDGSRVHFSRISDTDSDEHYFIDYVTPEYVVDPHGNETTLEYEIYDDYPLGQIRLKKVIDKASGRFLQFTYANPNAASFLVRIDGSNGDYVTYSYPNGELTHVEYRDGTTADYTYEDITTKKSTGEIYYWRGLASARDARAEGPMQSIRYHYKPQVAPAFRGQIEGEYHYDDGVLVSRFQCNAANGQATEASNKEFRGDGPSRTIEIRKTDAGDFPLVRSKTDFNNVSESYEYDANNWLRQVTDRRGKITTYTNTAAVGNPLTITHPQGTFADDTPFGSSQTIYTYTDNNNPYYIYSVTDDRQKTTVYHRYAHNAAVNPDRIYQIDYPDSGVEYFLYNDFGQVTQHKRKNGYYEHATYVNGLLTGLWNPTLSATRPDSEAHYTYTYYGNGSSGDVVEWRDRLRTVTDPLGNRTTYEYDKTFVNGVQSTTPCYGRGLITKIKYADDTHDGQYSAGTARSLTYDIYGNKRTETNEAVETTTYTYDDWVGSKLSISPTISTHPILITSITMIRLQT